MTARGWCITLHINEKTKDWRPKYDEDIMRCFAYQIEKGEKTGKYHWQMYIEFYNPVRRNQVKEIIGCESAHIDKRMGTPKQALKYVQKEESYVGGRGCHGSVAEKCGERSDLKALCERVVNGASLSEIAVSDSATFVRNYRGLAELQARVCAKRSWMTEIHIIWGESGSGKTSGVVNKEPSLFIKSNGQWWDGYEGEEAVLVDDVIWGENGGISREEWLKLGDRYPMKVPIKGGFREFVAKRIYITSNMDPSTFVGLTGMSRRVTSVTRLDLG